MRQWVTSILFGVFSVVVAVVSSLAGVSDHVFVAIMVGTLITLVPIAIQIDVVRVVGDEVKKGIAALEWTELASRADARIKSDADPLFREVASRQLENAAAILNNLSAGEATYSYGYEGDIILLSIQRTICTLRATHDCRESMRRALWLTDPLQRKYLEAQRSLLTTRQAVAPYAPLTIERTLVLPLRKDITSAILDEVARIAEPQEVAGISVHAITADDLNGRWDEDVVLIDDSCAHRYTFGARAPYEEVSVIVDRSKIAQLSALRDHVLRHERPWHEVAQDLAAGLRAGSPTFYDLSSRSYDDGAFGSILPGRIRDFLHVEGATVDSLLDLPIARPRVLFDFGCGTGQYLRRALQRYGGGELADEVIGVESSASIASIASEQLREFRNAKRSRG